MRHNPNERIETRDRMLAAFDQKMAKQVGHRGDLHIADFCSIDPDSGHLLIGYASSIGPASSKDVVAFIAKTFSGHVHPLMETAKQHREMGAVALVVARTIPKRKIQDRKDMLAISNTHFLDQQLGDTWEVKSQADGTKYLARIATDNLQDIIAERRRRMTVHASTVTFGNALSAGVPNLNSGDQVRFYDGGQLMKGKVTDVGHEVTITAEAGGTYNVSPEAVVEILQVSPDTTRDIKGYLGEYFADAYGFEDFAGKLTDELSR